MAIRNKPPVAHRIHRGIIGPRIVTTTPQYRTGSRRGAVLAVMQPGPRARHLALELSRAVRS